VKPGEKLERWIKETTHLTPTCASGAKFSDADFRNNDRIYEAKSSTMNTGIRIAKEDVVILLQRSRKLLRDPVFIYMNKNGEKFAIVPLKVFIPEAARNPRDWIRLELNPPIVVSRSNGISIKEHQLKDIPFENFGVLRYETKDGGQWIICDAIHWLELVGD